MDYKDKKDSSDAIINVESGTNNLKSTPGGLMEIFASITSNDWKSRGRKVDKMVTFIPANPRVEYNGGT
jgi:hypothetical protein